MKNTMNNSLTTISDDIKTQSNKFILSKTEDELYKEEKNIIMPIIRIKYYSLPNNGDKWKVFSDKNLLMTISGTKLNKKERLFLRGSEGTQFMLQQIKSGIKSFHGLKKALKIRLKKI